MNAKFQRPAAMENGNQPTPEFRATEFVTTTVPAPRGWRWIDLSLSLGLAGLLAWSWLWPRSRSIWDQVDATVFRLLNGALAFTWWQKGWAYLNHDYADWIAIALYGILFFYAGRYGKRSLRRSAISLAVLAVVVIGLRSGTHLAVTLGDGALSRPSPTLANPDALRLSELVPDVTAKDYSHCCFPSDHGFVVLAIVLYLGYWGPDRAVWMAVLLALAFVVPRMVAGAHWFTDIAIGSAVMALAATSLLMATPLHDWAVSTIDRRGATLGRRTTKQATQAAAAVPQTPRRHLPEATAAAAMRREPV
jgi:membrane-associated phospholipid phosphatase